MGQEPCFLTAALSLPSPDKGQRSYCWASDEIIASAFTSLSLSLTKTLAQSFSVTLAYGMEAGITFPALSQTHFSLVICKGWE